MQYFFKENLRRFLGAKNISQSELAKSLNSSNSRISAYLSGTSEPTLSFLVDFKKQYKIDLDEFLTKKCFNKEEKDEENSEFARFVNSYILYFYDSSAYHGRANKSIQNVLKYGVLCLIRKNNNLKAYCVFKKFRKDAELLKQELSSNISQSLHILNQSEEEVYEGEVSFSISQIFIFLKSFNDQTLIILNNPPSNKKYIGGLGTVNSVSRGREHMPCIQFILMCDRPLPLPEGEIYNLLCLEQPLVNLHGETDALIEMFKNLYQNEKNVLEEYQKKKIITDSLENLVEKNIESNIFRFAKVSGREDDFYYKLIKGEI